MENRSLGRTVYNLTLQTETHAWRICSQWMRSPRWRYQRLEFNWIGSFLGDSLMIVCNRCSDKMDGVLALSWTRIVFLILLRMDPSCGCCCKNNEQFLSSDVFASEYGFNSASLCWEKRWYTSHFTLDSYLVWIQQDCSTLLLLFLHSLFLGLDHTSNRVPK